MEKVLRLALFECITEITFVVAPLRNNLGGMTDRQTCADSVCYQMVIKYVKVKTNEHMKLRKCFHGHYNTRQTHGTSEQHSVNEAEHQCGVVQVQSYESHADVTQLLHTSPPGDMTVNFEVT